MQRTQGTSIVFIVLPAPNFGNGRLIVGLTPRAQTLSAGTQKTLLPLSVTRNEQMRNAEYAVKLLQDKGYEAESADDGKSVRVLEPVRCSRGARVWIEYEVRIIPTAGSLTHVRNFIVERE